jgi:hypothetical protein
MTAAKVDLRRLSGGTGSEVGGEDPAVVKRVLFSPGKGV